MNWFKKWYLKGFYKDALREATIRKIKGEPNMELAVRLFRFKLYQLNNGK